MILRFKNVILFFTAKFLYSRSVALAAELRGHFRNCWYYAPPTVWALSDAAICPSVSSSVRPSVCPTSDDCTVDSHRLGGILVSRREPC